MIAPTTPATVRPSALPLAPVLTTDESLEIALFAASFRMGCRLTVRANESRDGGEQYVVLRDESDVLAFGSDWADAVENALGEV